MCLVSKPRLFLLPMYIHTQYNNDHLHPRSQPARTGVFLYSNLSVLGLGWEGQRGEKGGVTTGLTHKFLPLNFFPHPNILILCTHFTTADLKFIGNSSKFVELILRSLR